MTDPTSKAWRCKHCNERVDPTMSLCWNCGYDREGHPPGEEAAVIGEHRVRDCPRCGYCLLGNTRATQCPECGYGLPASIYEWESYSWEANKPTPPAAHPVKRWAVLAGALALTCVLLLVFEPFLQMVSRDASYLPFGRVVKPFLVLGYVAGAFVTLVLYGLAVRAFALTRRPEPEGEEQP